MTVKLSAGKGLAIVVATRTTSLFSVLGSAFIIFTFLCFPFFRKPINRLVFFATFGNIMANVATLMSTSAIPSDGRLSELCEFQGVLIQWFMMADSGWVLCMATNVFLVFFYGYDSQQLRHLEKWYILLSYGIPAIPALTYVILDHSGRRVLGSATLWCWVQKDSDWMRIAFFYAPVWLVICTTIGIYVVTGVKIFRKRALLRSFSRQSGQPNAPRHSDNEENRINPFTALNNIVVTTQIKYDIQEQETASRCMTPEGDMASISSFSSTKGMSSKKDTNKQSSAPPPSAPTIHIHREHTRPGSSDRPEEHGGSARNGYRATAFAANTTTNDSPVFRTRSSQGNPPVRPRTTEGNAAAMAYLKVAFLMFMALFVVWVPSTVNRLYQFFHRDQSNYGLNIISAVVLPLQGAWNATIYIFTTRSECKRAYGLIISRLTGKIPPYQPKQEAYHKDTMTISRETRDSVAEIALDDFFKQGRVREKEISYCDDVADAAARGNYSMR